MKKVLVNQWLFLAWLVIVTLFKFLTRRWSLGVPLLWWWLGAMAGYLFVYLDVWFYELINNFNEALKWRLSNILALVKNYEEKEEYVMRSGLFLVVWLVLGVLAVTSVSSSFSRGLVWGIGTHLVLDLLFTIKAKGLNIDWWFRQIKRIIEDDEKRWFLIMVVLFYLFLAVNL